MLRQVRRKIASSISFLENGEDFLYSNWLRISNTKIVLIGSLSSKLIDTSFITYGFKHAFTIEHLFSFGDVILYPEDPSYRFGKIGTNPVFFQLLYVPSRVITHKDIDPKPPAETYRKVDLVFSKPVEWEITTQFKLKKPQAYLFRLSEPQIKDHLHNLKPKVRKIDLLNENDFVKNGEHTLIKEIEVKNFGDEKINNYKVDALPGKPKLYKIKVPGMGKYKSKIFSLKLSAPVLPTVSKYQNLNSIAYSDVTTELTPGFGIIKTNSPPYDLNFNINSAIMKDRYNEEGSSNDIIKKLLKRSFKVVWNSHKNSGFNLSKNEEKNVRFLAENNRAILAEEPGLNKIKVSLAALQYLFANNVVTNTLTIIPAYNSYTNIADSELGTASGWAGKLEKYIPGMSAIFVKGNDEERSLAWNKSSSIHFVEHINFIKDITHNLPEKKSLKSFDCIIIDEMQEMIWNINDFVDYFKNINPQILWVLSSSLDGELPAKVNKLLNNECRIENYKCSRLSDELDFRTEINYEEFWLEPGSKQKDEYKDALKECKKELKRILESGNPLRYQANIFMLLHKLFQVQNFASNSNLSPKTELLLHHVQSINDNGQQVIIFSQYDQQGTKKIERLLDESNISYISVSTGYSADQVRKSVSLFKTKKDVTVFLANDKVSRLNFGNYFVPYVIRFDSWWNPALVPQNIKLFEIDDDHPSKGTLNVFSYKMLDTIDEQIKRILLNKGLIEDSLIRCISPNIVNDLISVDEWVRIFGLPVEDDDDKYNQLYNETMERLQSLSLLDLKETLSRFFSTIGYSNIETFNYENSGSFDITGESKSGGKVINLFCRVLQKKEVFKKSIEEVLLERSENKRYNKFVITTGKFANECHSLVDENLTLVNFEKLAKYLIVLNLVHLQVEQPA
jgi:hypothetical protein